MSETVEILLSAFNGEKYLQEQLDSIAVQDYEDWKLMVRDDGSSDNTLEILKSFNAEFPGKVKMLNDHKGHLGVNESFTELLEQSDAAYIMFADQDDIWFPGKIRELLSALKNEEAILPGTPMLAFSDAEILDKSVKQSKTFLQFMKYNYRKGQQVFFLRNYVPGCSMLFNKALLKKIFKAENKTAIHDYRMILGCSVLGKLVYVDKPLMKYRLHSANLIGLSIQKTSWYEGMGGMLKNIIKYGFNNRAYRMRLYKENIEQIKILCNTFPGMVSPAAFNFMKAEKNYIYRKLQNIIHPYVIEKYLTSQITYIICF